MIVPEAIDIKLVVLTAMHDATHIQYKTRGTKAPITKPKSIIVSETSLI